MISAFMAHRLATRVDVAAWADFLLFFGVYRSELPAGMITPTARSRGDFFMQEFQLPMLIRGRIIPVKTRAGNFHEANFRLHQTASTQRLARIVTLMLV